MVIISEERFITRVKIKFGNKLNTVDCIFIFIAILCFDYVDHLSTLVGKMDLIIGIVLLVYGVFLTIVGFAGDNEPISSTA